jgi:hypothetical protein
VVKIRTLFCFIIILIILAGCSSIKISGTYKGENENWEIQDVVSIEKGVRIHEITAIPKDSFSNDDVEMIVSLDGIIETKTSAQKTDDGVYKARDANSIKVDIKDEVVVKVAIFPGSEKQEVITLNKVE